MELGCFGSEVVRPTGAEFRFCLRAAGKSRRQDVGQQGQELIRWKA